jgi:hypothetical protein
MKRREIKFVAGSLQLAPDRVEAVPALRKAAAGAPKRPGPARTQARKPAASKAARKMR